MEQPLIPGLAEEIVEAAQRVHRRRRHRLQLGTAAATFVVLVATFAVTATVQAPPAEAGVDIAVRDGVIEVRLTDLESRPDVVEDVLVDAGIDADVTAEAVGPSNLGRFVSASVLDDPAAVVHLDRTGGTFGGFSVPEGFEGTLVLVIGRPAENGERYSLASDAFAPDEPLACSELLERPARELADLVAERPDLDITVILGGAGESVTPLELPTSPYADWLIAGALAYSRTDLAVAVTEDGEPLLADPNAPSSPEPPATPNDDCD